MITTYLYLVKTYPILSSAIQVMILGMFGELLAIKLRTKKWNPFTAKQFMVKLLIWAFLGITFKYAFAGFFGFVGALVMKGYWFSLDNLILKAFSVSLFTNLLFGPCMMLFHRYTDNMIEKRKMDWVSLQKAWMTLFWFWIPAHTITFSLPSHLQVGLAAVWAVALGIILGFFGQKK